MIIQKSTVNVLLLDDEPFMLMLLDEMLSSLGLTEVTPCEKGIDALAWLDKPDYSADLIFLDINMPDMDGMEFVRHLATRQYQGSLIIISGEDERMLQTVEKLVNAHNIMALGHLQKPFKIAALSNLLGKWQPAWMNKPVQKGKTYNAHEIKTAIANNELINYYQPQIDVATGKVIGVEALVRWLHPQDGIVFPDQFIHVAEAFGLIDDVTKAVVEAAFAQASIWQKHTLALRVSVNISMDSLISLDFVDYLADAVAAAGIMASDIVLEVTESRLMKHLSVSLEALSRLRLKRFGLSIDDFGTGYSSFSLLHNIPFNELKVDQSFVHGATRNKTQYAIYDSSLTLAQRLGMHVVAEGIEDWEDWNLLRNTGCDMAQGFFIAKPMPAANILDWISDWEANIENFMNSANV